MERNAATSNFGGTLVFPGGKVEPGDEEIVQQVASSVHAAMDRTAYRNCADLSQAQLAGLYGAALRETVEEVGLIWQQASGAAALPHAGAQMRQALAQGQSWQQACAALGLVPSVAALQPWSRWLTPTAPNMSVKRFDAFFFLATDPGDGQTAQVDGHEASRLLWNTPRGFLHDFERGDILLAPPQIMTLAHISRFASVQALQDYARKHAFYYMNPISYELDGHRTVCFPGDALHDNPQAAMPGPTRLQMQNKRFMPPGGLDALFQ